jgi:murein DD-endopeptidase MepM/ murein hydrolase activator NlpD
VIPTLLVLLFALVPLVHDEPMDVLACRPVPGEVVDHFGSPRPGGRAHAGTDFAGERGQVIYAAFSGEVADIRYEPTGGGIVVEVHHPDGTKATYMHMFDAAMAGRVPVTELPLPVAVGDRVEACDPIGYVGNSGFSRIYHLHFSFAPIDGWNIDPERIEWHVVPPERVYPYWLPDRLRDGYRMGGDGSIWPW